LRTTPRTKICGSVNSFILFYLRLVVDTQVGRVSGWFAGPTGEGVAGGWGRHPSGRWKADVTPVKKARWSSTGGSMPNRPKELAPNPNPPPVLFLDAGGPSEGDILRRPSKAEYSSANLVTIEARVGEGGSRYGKWFCQ
jgi:hypothetical protein